MKKNILFFAPSLKFGGAERVLISLLKNIDNKKFNSSLALISKEGHLLKELPRNVNIIDVGTRKVRFAFVKLLNIILSDKPDIIFSTIGHLNLLVILTKLFSPKKIKYICRETNIPSLVHKNFFKSLIFSFLYKCLYRYYDYVICQSKDMKYDLLNRFNIPETKLLLINNPCDIRAINSKLQKSKKTDFFKNNKIHLLTVGSLTYQKGHDLLIEAIGKMDKDRFDLTIIGEGKNKTMLKNLTENLNLLDNIHFIGLKDNPYSYMYHADLFVLSSRYEGFPNVVLESMACGTAVVAFKTPGDIHFIIKNGLNGYLVDYPNTDKLAETISRAALENLNPEKIKETIKTRYSIEKIIPIYENAFLH